MNPVATILRSKLTPYKGRLLYSELPRRQTKQPEQVSLRRSLSHAIASCLELPPHGELKDTRVVVDVRSSDRTEGGVADNYVRKSEV